LEVKVHYIHLLLQTEITEVMLLLFSQATDWNSDALYI